MTGPPVDPQPTEFKQVQNATATRNMLELLGIQGPLRFKVGDTIVPVALLSGDDDVRTDRPAIGTQFIAGGATLTHQQLQNPAGSGVRVHVDTATVSVAAAQAVTLRALIGVPLTTLGTFKTFRDLAFPSLPVAELRGVVVATQGGEIANFTMQTNTNNFVPIDMWLDPGESVLFQNAVVGGFLKVVWYWEESPVGS